MRSGSGKLRTVHHIKPCRLPTNALLTTYADSGAYTDCFATAGKTPVAMAVGGTRQKRSMIATVTNQGKARWMIIDCAFDADKFIEFLPVLIKVAGNRTHDDVGAKL